jgi:23S rRNA (uracil1939-C5)-methyltransferase
MQSVVTIEKLVYGGAALARTESGVTFVDGALPGETVRIEVTGKKGGIAAARTVEVLAPSPDRRTPPCPVAGICGGCDWQHLSYKAQVAAKTAIFQECMQRIGRLADLPAPEVFSADEFGYRQRVQLKINTRGEIGFFAKRSNEVVPIRSCPLLLDPLNVLIAELPGRLPSIPAIDTLMAVAGDNGGIASFPVIRELTAERVAITAANIKFQVAGNSFFQSNRLLLEGLGTWARPMVRGDRFVDLYGGSGFFSCMLAGRFTEGLLIESVGPQVKAAQENFNGNGINHVKAVEGRAEGLLQLAGKKPVSCLIVDPPRAGLSQRVREAVAAMKPETIVYISCNPSTQARDVGFLVNKAGYEISNCAIFDLYPNSYHIESIVILKRMKDEG